MSSMPACLYCVRQVDLLELLYRLERGRAPGLVEELGALRDEALDKFMVGMRVHACMQLARRAATHGSISCTYGPHKVYACMLDHTRAHVARHDAPWPWPAWLTGE